jgi:hypothetical protein
MATVGLAGLLSLVGTSEAQSLATAQRVAVAVVTGGAVVGLMIAGRAAHRHPAVRSVLLATGSGIAFGVASVFTKLVAVDWNGGVSAADLPALGTIGVFATAGLLLSQAAYRGAGLAAPLATLTVVNPVVAAAVGITMFGETFRYGTTGTALALSCGVVAAGGLILLTTERIARTEAETAAEPALPEPSEDLVSAGELLAGLSTPTASGPDDMDIVVPDKVEDLLVPDGQHLLLADEADGVLVPAQSRQSAYGDGEPSAPEPVSHPYGPFYGGPYVPMPGLDRHRSRVKS